MDFGSLAVASLKCFVVLIITFVFAIITAWLDRKQGAVVQDRVGPARADFLGLTLFGLIHPIADALKFFTKENFMPARANRFLHNLAPLVAFCPVLFAFAVVPFGEAVCLEGTRVITDGVALCVNSTTGATERAFTLQVANLDAGILFVLAIGSLAVFGAAMAGWSSNNKYSLLGGLRASLQMFSYEIVLGLSIVSIIMIYGSVDLAEMVRGQGGEDYLFGVLPRWGIIMQPVAAVLFMTAAIAETKRVPFDLPEGESEIVAGYHLEFSSSKFMMFFMGEYMEMILLAAIFTMLFFGGWHIPYFLDTDAGWSANWPYLLAVGCAGGVAFGWLLMRSGRERDSRSESYLGGAILVTSFVLGLYFLYRGLSGTHEEWSPGWLAVLIAATQISVVVGKMLLLILFQMFVRWTLPRFRYDQVMVLGWKMMLPLALANIVLTAFLLLL